MILFSFVQGEQKLWTGSNGISPASYPNLCERQVLNKTDFLVGALVENLRGFLYATKLSRVVRGETLVQFPIWGIEISLYRLYRHNMNESKPINS